MNIYYHFPTEKIYKDSWFSKVKLYGCYEADIDPALVEEILKLEKEKQIINQKLRDHANKLMYIGTLARKW